MPLRGSEPKDQTFLKSERDDDLHHCQRRRDGDRESDSILALAPEVGRAMKPGARVAWLSSAQATDYLGFPSQKAFLRWLERKPGTLRRYRLGRRLRFRQVDLDSCVEEVLDAVARLTLVRGGRV